MEKEKAEIAELAAKYGRVQSLMRFVNKETLAKSYSCQPKGKAVGVDGMTKEAYGENLNENLEDLLKRMKQFSYKPYPVRRAYIPKGNGKMRGLGIPSFEDKVVQGVFKEILEGIYEPKFQDFSYGFRPNRSCHDAIQKVNKHIMADKVNYVVDADIKGFFDNIDHDWMVRFLEHDIADKNFIRYIKRFLIGGVMEDGKKLSTELGTVQGGLISPVLAYVMFGQIIPKETSEETKKEIKRRNPELAHEVDSIPIKSQRELNAAATVLQAITAYVMTNRWVVPSKSEFIREIDCYIEAHLSENITVDDICSAFRIGRTKIYELSMDYLGCGLAEYVRKQRVEHAKRMLTEMDMPITDIAFATGFADYNHFSRIFKQTVELSAREYRKKGKE